MKHIKSSFCLCDYLICMMSRDFLDKCFQQLDWLAKVYIRKGQTWPQSNYNWDFTVYLVCKILKNLLKVGKYNPLIYVCKMQIHSKVNNYKVQTLVNTTQSDKQYCLWPLYCSTFIYFFIDSYFVLAVLYYGVSLKCAFLKVNYKGFTNYTAELSSFLR